MGCQLSGWMDFGGMPIVRVNENSWGANSQNRHNVRTQTAHAYTRYAAQSKQTQRKDAYSTCASLRKICRVGQNHIYIRCTSGIFGREFAKYTVMYGVYIRF